MAKEAGFSPWKKSFNDLLIFFAAGERINAAQRRNLPPVAVEIFLVFRCCFGLLAE
jgi:hypothetical protein